MRAALARTYSLPALPALPPGPARADLDRLVWAPLNRPLRAWPDAAWFARSDAVGEIPAGPLPKRLAAYDKLGKRGDRGLELYKDYNIKEDTNRLKDLNMSIAQRTNAASLGRRSNRTAGAGDWR